MQHPIPSLLPILLFLCCLATPMAAQPIDSVRPVVIVDSTRLSSSLYYSLGTTPMSVTNLNTFLAANGFGENRFTTGFLDGGTLLGAGVRVEVNRWSIASEAAILFPERSNSNGAEINHSFWQIQSNVGYLAMSSDNFLLFPLAGLGARFNRLTIDETNENSFQGILNGSGRSFGFSNQSLYFELGAGTEYSFLLSENERSVSRLAFGLRGGYLIGLGNDEWRLSGGGKVSGGPEMGASGPHLALTVGLRTLPRIYQATILSERAPTSDVEHSSRLEPASPETPDMAGTPAAPEAGIRFGLKGGFTISNINEPDSFYDGRLPRWLSTRNAPTVGAFASIPLGGMLELQPELLFARRGGELYESSFRQLTGSSRWDTTYDLTTRYNADYIELPLLAKVRSSLGSTFAVTLLAGLYGAVLVGSETEYERRYSSMSGMINRDGFTTTSSGELDVDPFDAGTVYGFGFDLTLWGQQLDIDLRAWRGFSNVGSGKLHVRNQGVSMMAGYRF